MTCARLLSVTCRYPSARLCFVQLAARALASLEMFVGLMYLAAVVSRLSGLTRVQRGNPR